VKRTDDFLADLEAQLAAAAPVRRVRPAAVLRPALVAFAAVALAVGLARVDWGDPERAADLAAPPGGAFVLPAAERGRCAVVPEAEPGPVAGMLGVLRRPGGDGRARADAPATVVASRSGCMGQQGPGACVTVELDGIATACFTETQIRNGQAAAALGAGFVVALLPDRYREVTFKTVRDTDAYAVTDNVVVGNLDGLAAGDRIEMIAGSPGHGCGGDLIVEDGPFPEELLVAVHALDGPGETLPGPVVDLLRRAGAERAWTRDAVHLPGDGSVDAWLVGVVDSRFAECGEPLVQAPRAFEGPGACLVALGGGKPIGALCTDLDDFANEVLAPEIPGGRVLLAFLPHDARSVHMDGEQLPESARGVAFGPVPADADLRPTYLTADQNPAEKETVAVVGREVPGVRERLARGGWETSAVGAHAPVERSQVLYAGGFARTARRIAELLRIGDVQPMAEDAEADVVVVAGADLVP
jgi:hypothetical protein